MTLKRLLVVTAIVEIGTGAFLLSVPGAVLALLLGLETPSPETQFVGRVAGAALLAIGIASGLARNDAGSAGLWGLLIGILVYDGSVAALLAYAGSRLDMTGLALWPAVVLHTALAIWCVVCLRFLAHNGRQMLG